MAVFSTWIQVSANDTFASKKDSPALTRHPSKRYCRWFPHRSNSLRRSSMDQEVISAEELLDILNTDLRNAGIDAKECEFAAVKWHAPDAGGCNWGATFTRHDASAKVQEAKVGGIVLEASKKFNIPDSR